MAYFSLAVVVFTIFMSIGATLRGPALDGSDLYIIPLRRESLPVQRQGRTVSFKTSFSGLISIGNPATEFKVVFDTGSGHVVVPDSKCQSGACTIGKKAYDLDASSTGQAINSKGQVLPAHATKRPHVKISFGTGGIKGEFVKDVVCVGAAQSNDTSSANHGDYIHNLPVGCVEVHILSAVVMTDNPFLHSHYDGILGLGLQRLSVSNNFSFIDVLAQKHLSKSQFAVFLTEEENGEDSEISFGGHIAKRSLEPLFWNPVALKELGYWQVRILSVRIDGTELDVCKDGTCRGAVDTGSSHLGLPAPFDKDITAALTAEAADLLDCRLAKAPVLEFELETGTLTLHAENYMRRLPVRDGVRVGASRTFSDHAPQVEENDIDHVAVVLEETHVRRQCLPKTVGVDMERPVGPKFFVLGQPLLHKYYTVFDWETPQVGFARANNKRNTAGPPEPGFRGTLPDDVELLLQMSDLA